MVIEHEGLLLNAYDDATGQTLRTGDTVKGQITIGYGRNLQHLGLSKEEASLLLEHDLARCAEDLDRQFSWFEELNSPRQDALIDMCYNMGIKRLKTFKRMLEALSHHKFERAKLEALDSRWAQTHPLRANHISNMLGSGHYPKD